jgi:phosphate transport system substrate-binding protein
MTRRLTLALALALAGTVGLYGCSGNHATDTGSTGEELRGEIKVDGSSTVFLITQAVATNFRKQHPRVDISVGISGTGGGFKKFAAGETDISDASRPIRPAEAENCKKNGIDYLELQVAWDGLAVIINKDNDWARQMTVEQLRKIWHPDMAARKWSDVDPSWPDEPIRLFGAGPDSGTFDYFTEAVNGKEKLCRTDYQATEDDNNTIKGVEGNKYALGFLGVAYYEAHKDKLGIVAVAEKAGAPYVLPTSENVLSNDYRPLSRPLFIYVKTEALKRPEVIEFIRFYQRRQDLVRAVQYVPLSIAQQAIEQKKFEDALQAMRQAPAGGGAATPPPPPP